MIRKRWKSLVDAAFQPVDIAGLVVFRIAFGLIMVWEYFRYVEHDRIRRYFMVPEFHFTYLGFDWVTPWGADGMLFHFAGLAVLGLAIAIGFCYRLSATLFFLGFTYVLLLDKANYLNHFYLISLISGLLIIVPAHRAFSLDARWRPGDTGHDVPAWTIWLLRFQIAIPYIYGGIAKLSGDWLAGEPMRTWLRSRSDFPVIGQYFTEEWMVLSMSYGGLLFDLLVVPMLLWRKTRAIGFVLSIIFHLMNARLFSIGIFPWLMIAATTLFLPTSWPRFGDRFSRHRDHSESRRSSAPKMVQVVGAALLIIYVGVQILVPFRHWLYPGNVSWTGEGHRFAWRMKLNSKRGEVRFLVVNPTTKQHWSVHPGSYVTRRQYGEMCHCPDMILQLAKHIAVDFRHQGQGDVEVYAQASMSLNGRPHMPLIDPSVNLAVEIPGLLPAKWILPAQGHEFRNVARYQSHDDQSAPRSRLSSGATAGASIPSPSILNY